MLKRSKSTSCFVFRNEVKRKTRSENDIQSYENSFEKRKIEVGEELAKKWMYTVVNFEHGFSIYLYRKGFNLNF